MEKSRHFPLNFSAENLWRHSAFVMISVFILLSPVQVFAQATIESLNTIALWTGAMDRLISWQATLQRNLAGAIRSLQSGEVGPALWSLLSLSFLYGVVHAAGPGHGKAVVSSYLFAQGATIRKGLWLAFSSAALQGGVAVILVSTLGIVFTATRAVTQEAGRWLELISAGLIVLFGLRMLWLILLGYGHHHHHHHHHHHQDHKQGECSHVTHKDHIFSIAALVGIRPCSGALLILFFTLSQGVFWAGVLSTIAISIGTALTVAGLAFLALSARQIALRLTAEKSIGLWMDKLLRLIGAAAVTIFGVLLFMVSWTQAALF